MNRSLCVHKYELEVFRTMFLGKSNWHQIGTSAFWIVLSVLWCEIKIDTVIIRLDFSSIIGILTKIKRDKAFLDKI